MAAKRKALVVGTPEDQGGSTPLGDFTVARSFAGIHCAWMPILYDSRRATAIHYRKEVVDEHIDCILFSFSLQLIFRGRFVSREEPYLPTIG